MDTFIAFYTSKQSFTVRPPPPFSVSFTQTEIIYTKCEMLVECLPIQQVDYWFDSLFVWNWQVFPFVFSSFSTIQKYAF